MLTKHGHNDVIFFVNLVLLLLRKFDKFNRKKLIIFYNLVISKGILIRPFSNKHTN